MPFTSISAGWIFTLMGLLDDGRPLNQGKSQSLLPRYYSATVAHYNPVFENSAISVVCPNPQIEAYQRPKGANIH